jgi:16S rRNA (guanine(527)-N(7))-methyltransferase RsmG
MSAEVFRELLEQRADAADLILNPFLKEKLASYFDLLVHWNNRINLTGLPLEPPTSQAVDRLVIEPLVAASLIDANISVWFDLGSGGGSPAIPLQLAHPASRLIMVESRDRKAAFLREVIRELSLAGTEVEVSRIEEVAASVHNAGVADLVTVRAVRLGASLVSQVQTLLRFRGQAVLFGARISQTDLPRGLEPADTVAKARGVVVLRRNGL